MFEISLTHGKQPQVKGKRWWQSKQDFHPPLKRKRPVGFPADTRPARPVSPTRLCARQKQKNSKGKKKQNSTHKPYGDHTPFDDTCCHKTRFVLPPSVCAPCATEGYFLKKLLLRPGRIELPPTAWEAVILPLNYGRGFACYFPLARNLLFFI